MKIESGTGDTFRVTSTQRDFPPLPGTGEFLFLTSCERRIEKQKADDRPTAIQRPVTCQRMSRHTYAEMAARAPPPRKKIVSNHPAYKAWLERQAIQGKQKKAPAVASTTLVDHLVHMALCRFCMPKFGRVTRATKAAQRGYLRNLNSPYNTFQKTPKKNSS